MESTTHPEQCLAVVMACYNEAATVEDVVDSVLASPFTAELVIVDDGSTDGTAELVAKIGDPRVTVIHQGVNLGKGAALRRGFTEVRAPFVIVQDADLEYDPDDYERLLAPLLADHADVVYGSRFSPRPHRVMYFWNSVANHIVTLASNATTNLNLTDVATGYKVFRREVLDSFELEHDRFGFEIEFTAKAARAGWRFYEVGVSYDGRTYAEGKKMTWLDGLRVVYCIGRYSDLGVRLSRPRLNIEARGEMVGFHEADAELEDTLDSLDDASNYADWIVAMIGPHVHGEIIEIGAGHGTMSERLTRLGRVTASEPSARAAALLRERFAGNPLISVAEGTADAVMAPGQFDAAVLINVLEHIPDDRGALEAIYTGLRPGGTVAIFVPAHEVLYSRFDRMIGHQRRYRRSTLAQVMSRAGFDLDELRYVNFPGVLAWFAVARVMHRTPTESATANLFDRVAVPIISRIEKRWRMPIGLSLLAIGRKPHE